MNVYHRRIERIQREFRRSSATQALLLSSAPTIIQSRDANYPFRQDSDFYYLTGTTAEDLIQLISSNEGAPILFAHKRDNVKILWEGKGPDLKSVAKRIKASLVITDNIRGEVLARLKGVDTLFFQNVHETKGWKIAQELIAFPSAFRMNYPARFAHSDTLLEKMRLYKDEDEIALIKKAASVTNLALEKALPLVRAGFKESDIAAALNYWYRRESCDEAFPTIAASGPSAATLHYRDCSRVMKNGELLLIDCGAQYKMYAADITRVVPVSGIFTPLQEDLYLAVLEAQRAAISKVRHGAKVKSVYDAAAKAITYGLIQVGVLKGKLSKLLAKQAYKPYFPHGIGHSLGIDVHDIGNLRGNNGAVLEAGMVVTIEPGLYFSKRVGSVAPCGIRIEDDVQVTKSGYKILTAGFPKDVRGIEELMAERQ